MSLNAKLFVRILTMNETVAMNRIKSQIKTEIIPWHQKYQIQITCGDLQSIIPKDKKYDLTWIHCRDAAKLQTSDMNAYNLFNYTLRNNTPYVPMIYHQQYIYNPLIYHGRMKA